MSWRISMVLAWRVRPAQSLLIARRFVLGGLCLCLLPAAAYAQAGKEGHWGVSFSATPQWTLAAPLKKALSENGETNIKGNEVTVGVVHGSTLGGDWGVSFVRKPFDNS